jgi:hypothetical protein
MVEPAAERTAAEVALNCLRKGQLLGSGWSIMWPGIPKASPQGWSLEMHGFAALPESLDGLTGGFADGMGIGRSLIPRLYSASFTVTVLPEDARN